MAKGQFPASAESEPRAPRLKGHGFFRFPSQLLKCERLCQKVQVVKLIEPVAERAFSIAADANDPEVRLRGPDMLDQSRPIHIWHNYIRDQQVKVLIDVL